MSLSSSDFLVKLKNNKTVFAATYEKHTHLALIFDFLYLKMNLFFYVLNIGGYPTLIL